MTSHKMFRLGKACVGLSALAAPAPLITCAIDGRAGASVLLPVIPLAAAITLLAGHGTNAGACDGCMGEVIDRLEATPGIQHAGLTEPLDAFDLNQAA